ADFERCWSSWSWSLSFHIRGLTGRMVASRDCGEVDLGVVDAVEDVGEDRGRERQADVDQLGVAVAGGLDRGEILVADGAARLCKLADEADQRIALAIACGVAVANVLEFVGLRPCKLAEEAVRGHAVIAAGDTAD